MKLIVNTATDIHAIIAYKIMAHETDCHYERYLYKLVLSYRRLNISKLRHYIIICIV